MAPGSITEVSSNSGLTVSVVFGQAHPLRLTLHGYTKKVFPYTKHQMPFLIHIHNLNNHNKALGLVSRPEKPI